jgi:hypothetical protein
MMIVALLAALAVALAAGPAGARRDDLPPEVYAPESGATVADATRGLAVEFTCPVYHRYPQDELVTAPTQGYHVILSTRSDVDDHRLLLPTGRVEVREARSLDDKPGHCTAVEDGAGNGLLPREPGTYYWQVYRDCETYVCPGGVEAGDVATVTVQRTICTATRGALATARTALAQAKAAARRRPTVARRVRVSRLRGRVTMLGARLIVVYGCAVV